MFKKFLSVCMAVLFVCGCATLSASAKVSADVDTHLQYGADGKFRIMQVADIQDSFPMRSITKREIHRALQSQNPDLVVLTGDNIGARSSSKWQARMAIRSFMDIFEKYGVPVAMVFGNHDDQDTVANKAFQLSVYEEYSCFVGCAGEDFGEGFLGTYYVPIYSSADKNEMVSNVWMIDSGTYNTENNLGGYACVSKAEIEWYKTTSAALEQQYGHKIPSVMFQHIIVPEIWSILEECPVGTPGSVKASETRAYKLPAGSKGEINEIPCPPPYTNGQLQAADERGDVLAMFFGHDHTNSYEIERAATDIINSPGVGFKSYNGRNVGVRMITLDENNPWEYKTEVVTYLDMFAGEPAALALFDMYSSTSTAKQQIAGFFRFILYSLIPIAAHK